MEILPFKKEFVLEIPIIPCMSGMKSLRDIKLSLTPVIMALLAL